MFLFKNRKKEIRQLSQFLDTGFHGDKNLQKVVDTLMKDCSVFIETGTNVGSTLAYVAKRYPHIRCLSCEPHKASFDFAVSSTKQYSNVQIFNLTSEDFIEELRKIDLSQENILFWLDAHGYGFKWPLKQEISFITNQYTKAHVLIDDFKVPEFPSFKWDSYKGQECSFDYIKDSIKKNLNFYVGYPASDIKTSTVHPLTGWGLITFGFDFSCAKNELLNVLKVLN